MADLKDQADKRGPLCHYDPARLEIKPGLNCRNPYAPEEAERLSALADEIITDGGVRQPLEIFSEGEHIYISHGHFRKAAALLARERGMKILTVPCIIEPKGGNDAKRIVDQYRLNNLGNPLTDLQIGYNICRLLKMGWDMDMVCKEHGRSRSWADGILLLQEASPVIQAAVTEGSISPTLAKQIVREQAPAEAEETIVKAVADAKAEAAATGKTKAKATARHVRRPLPPLAAAPPQPDVKPDSEVVVFSSMPGGDRKVTFGNRPVTMTRPDWVSALKKIAVGMHIRYDEIATIGGLQ